MLKACLLTFFSVFCLLLFPVGLISGKNCVFKHITSDSLHAGNLVLYPCPTCPLGLGSYVSLRLPDHESAQTGQFTWRQSDWADQKYTMPFPASEASIPVDASGNLDTGNLANSAPDFNTPFRDLSQSDESGAPEYRTYTLSFCGRRGFPGHAFIRLYKTRYRDYKTECTSFGLFPRKLIYGYWSMLWQVPAYMRDEGTTRTDVQYKIEISRAEYDKILELKEKWNQNGRFHLFNHDCVTFTRTICALFSNRMLTPERAWFSNFPYRYIKKLHRVNMN